MCIIAFAIREHAQISLVLIHNRDEVLSRGTVDACLNPSTGIICGTDQKQGGTWMGFNTLNVCNATLCSI